MNLSRREKIILTMALAVMEWDFEYNTSLPDGLNRLMKALDEEAIKQGEIDALGRRMHEEVKHEFN